jgi:MFS family permease
VTATADSDVDPPSSSSVAVTPRWDRAVTMVLAAKLAEMAGTTALVTALGKQVYDLSGRELDLGLLGLAEFAPAALLVLLTGSVADRHDRRRVAGAASFAESLAALAILAYVASSPQAVGPLFALTVAFGVARAFVAPAQRSLPADVVSPDRLPWLTARWAIVFQMGMVMGPASAGMLYAIDAQLAFAAIAVLFAISAICCLLIPRSRQPAVTEAAATDAADDIATGSRRSPATMGERLHDALEGLRLIRRQPILFGAVSLDLFAVLFGGAVALLPAIAEERLGVGPVGFGWLRAAPGIGASAMMILLAVRPIRQHVGRRLLAAVAVFGLGTILLGATTNYAVAFAALLLLAAADACSVFIRVTLVGLVTPHNARGRVLAVENVFIGASNELGAFESGVTGQLFGPAPAVALGGVATLAVAATWWHLFPALRNVDAFPPGPAPDPNDDG